MEEKRELSVAVHNLSFRYPGTEDWALDAVNLTVAQGEFLLLCGPSGSGKSTLLRQLKREMAPQGSGTGEIYICNQREETLDLRAQCQMVGFVGQSVQHQLVTDKVWHELAFGLERLGLDNHTIRRRVAEMASFFGIQEWFYRPVAQLSGGQKQIVNLAAVMVMQPKILVLDEPTAQLDPIATVEFLQMLTKLNREFGTTIVLSEHNLEEALPCAHSVAVMQEGKLVWTGEPQEIGVAPIPKSWLLPAPVAVWQSVDRGSPCPITVGEGRSWLAQRVTTAQPSAPLPETEFVPGEIVLSCHKLWFKYEKNGPDIVKNLSLQLHRGEIFGILGGNGTGKTTALTLLSGLKTPQRGKINCTQQVGFLPQNPQTLFVKATVEEDLWEVFFDQPIDHAGVERVVTLCQLEKLLQRHPYDLSGGEQQRVALAKFLLLKPQILLLDEPTKGLDGAFKAQLGEILGKLAGEGTSIILVTHDVEFCAQFAHRCGLFFDGTIITQGQTRAFFQENAFYTTAANRMSRHILPHCIVAEDIIQALGGSQFPPSGGVPQAPAGACVQGDVDTRYERAMPSPPQSAQGKNTVNFSSKIAIALCLLAIPLTLYLGMRFFGDKRYYFTSILVLLECMIPFFLGFEGRRPHVKEVATIATLCALTVAGRGAFFMLPQCKPVMAIVIVTGLALGCETGFLVGAISMLASNMLFSQGPWTPWQMFAMGIVGILAGMVGKIQIFHRKKLPLSIFGGLCAVLVYGVIVNTGSALLWSNQLEWRILLGYYLTGLPMDIIHGVATGVFLWLLAQSMLEKLARIKVKYGILSME